jgi:hypothetical protein
MARWARAVLCNGLGRYAEAAGAASQAAADPLELGPPKWALAELVEAGVRSGDDRAAAAALEQLSAMTRASGTDWALGIEASRRALLHDGCAADALHREAIERLGRTTVRVELARTAPLRRVAAAGRPTGRCQSAAADSARGADGDGCRRVRRPGPTGALGHRADGAQAHGRDVDGADVPGSADRPARRRGFTNPEVASALFLSPRTVEWHLRKVFAKLNINSRRQLRPSLRDTERTAILARG